MPTYMACPKCKNTLFRRTIIEKLEVDNLMILKEPEQFSDVFENEETTELDTTYVCMHCGASYNENINGRVGTLIPVDV